MKLYFLLLLLSPVFCISQNRDGDFLERDTLLFIERNTHQGFSNDYLLFIPKGTPKNESVYLLIETNNTGTTSDSMEVHKLKAIEAASKSSIGNNISTELRIPLLVPIFPRPESKPLVYTHALDRDVILESTGELERLDLQLISMIENSRKILEELEIKTYPKIFMNGFSASATFANRFSLIHPELIEALAIGGFNGILMVPQKDNKGIDLDYPLGLNDFSEIFGKEFQEEIYKTIPQYVYMGALDENDAVQFTDAYGMEERKIINSVLGSNVAERWQRCQEIYAKNGISATFKTYDQVGHFTTSLVNLDIIMFFYNISK